MPNKFLLYVLPVPVAYAAYKYWHNNDQLKEDLNWAWNRVPNFGETLTLSSPMALLSVAFEPYVEQLYQNNPASKTVLRNAISIGSTYLASRNQNEIGGTGVKYDEGHVMGNVFVSSCKAGLIVAMSPNTGEPGSREFFSLQSNYFCEPLGRSFNLISQNKQQLNATDVNYFDFAINNFSIALAMQALSESIAKVTLANQVGAMWGYLGLFPFVKNIYVGLENEFVSYMVGASAAGTLLVDRSNAVWQTNHHVVKKSAVIAGLVIIDASLKICAEVITSYLMTPPVRIVQDVVGLYAKQGYDEITNFFNNMLHSAESEDNSLGVDTASHHNEDAAEMECPQHASNVES